MRFKSFLRHGVRALCVGAATLMAGLVPASAWAGPFGNKSDTGGSYLGMDIAFNPRNISSTGTSLILGDDEVSGAIPIGFGFSFYGNTYSQLYVSSNGFLTFNSLSPHGCCTGSTLPSASTPNNLIAGYWEDLYRPGGGSIRYQTLGTAGNREFIAGFYGVPHFSAGNPVSFEMILHENATHDIEFQWINAPSDGGTHSAGIENATGTNGVQIFRGNVSVVGQGYLLRDPPPAPPPAAVPEPGSLGLAAAGLAAVWRLRRRTQGKRDLIGN